MLAAPFDRSKKNGFPFPITPTPLPTVPADPSVADQAAFTVLDGNGDGSVSKDEWTRAGWTADRFQAFDANGDGKISQDEFLKARSDERDFQDKDTNHDGSLTEKEFESQGTWLSKLGGAVQNAIGFFPGSGQLMTQAQRFKKYDKNGDGKVSEAEYIAGRRAEDSQPVPIMPSNPPIWYA
ncbi:MAG TPA: EF-hand domain-containing protein [Oscillatoriaceae cyanobacterium]